MPDDSDYRELQRLLDHPGAWTRDEKKYVLKILDEQKAMVESAHPADAEGRARLKEVVEQIEAAITAHERGSSGPGQS